MTSTIWQPNYSVKVSGKLKKQIKKQHKKSPQSVRENALYAYHQSLLPPNLPSSSAYWLHTAPRSIRLAQGCEHPLNISNVDDRPQFHAAEQLAQLIRDQRWRWPKKAVVYITDPHADAEALFHSLVASGGIERTGPGLQDFRLSRFGKSAHFVIGGDCFDKGPSNLRLLDFIKLVKNKGAKLTILAGNHDLRVMFGMQQVGKYCPRNSHFFARMGIKCIPLIQELIERHALDRQSLDHLPSEEDCRKALLPVDGWFERFPVEAAWVMPEVKINKEVERIKKKMSDFLARCEALNLSLRLVYAAVLKFQDEFLSKKGQYAWFYKGLKLALHEGSFLFLHAGVDDQFSAHVSRLGIKKLNQRFRRDIHESTPFELYYGSFFNTVRTKYRKNDLPFTQDGAQDLRSAGIQAIVQGHVNQHEGQGISIRQNIINIECDVTLDRNSRIRHGLTGAGAGCTLILPSQQIVGISTDWHQAKLLDMASQAIH